MFCAVFDSTAKPESGVLTGGLTFLGYYSECIAALQPGRRTATANESQVPPFTSTYCLATVSFANAQRWPPKVRLRTDSVDVQVTEWSSSTPRRNGFLSSRRRSLRREGSLMRGEKKKIC